MQKDLDLIIQYLQFSHPNCVSVYVEHPYQFASTGTKTLGYIRTPGSDWAPSDLWIEGLHVPQGAYLKVPPGHQVSGIIPKADSHHSNHINIYPESDYIWISEELTYRMSDYLSVRADSRFRPEEVKNWCTKTAFALNDEASFNNLRRPYKASLKEAADVDIDNIPPAVFDSFIRAFLKSIFQRR